MQYKSNRVPAHARKAYEGWNIIEMSFLTSALDGGE
jgi:hypothetical protein